MKIVKFKDGTYGIRKGIFSYKYVDIQNDRFWWAMGSHYFHDCKSDLNKVTKLFEYLTDEGEPVEGKKKLFEWEK